VLPMDAFPIAHKKFWFQKKKNGASGLVWSRRLTSVEFSEAYFHFYVEYVGEAARCLCPAVSVTSLSFIQ
jgi:hypothetical protein